MIHYQQISNKAILYNGGGVIDSIVKQSKQENTQTAQQDSNKESSQTTQTKATNTQETTTKEAKKGKTLKELQEQKRQEQEALEKRTQDALDKMGKYSIMLNQIGSSIPTELIKDIPTAKKDLLMKALYFENMTHPYKIAKYNGHVLEPNSMIIDYCLYVTEFKKEMLNDINKKIRDKRYDEGYISYFKGEYGVVDSCIFSLVDRTSSSRYQLDDKTKKAFVKWLQDIKFYDYIENLELVNDTTKAQVLLNQLENLKKNISKIK